MMNAIIDPSKHEILYENDVIGLTAQPLSIALEATEKFLNDVEVLSAAVGKTLQPQGYVEEHMPQRHDYLPPLRIQDSSTVQHNFIAQLNELEREGSVLPLSRNLQEMSKTTLPVFGSNLGILLGAVGGGLLAAGTGGLVAFLAVPIIAVLGSFVGKALFREGALATATLVDMLGAGKIRSLKERADTLGSELKNLQLSPNAYEQHQSHIDGINLVTAMEKGEFALIADLLKMDMNLSKDINKIVVGEAGNKLMDLLTMQYIGLDGRTSALQTFQQSHTQMLKFLLENGATISEDAHKIIKKAHTDANIDLDDPFAKVERKAYETQETVKNLSSSEKKYGKFVDAEKSRTYGLGDDAISFGRSGR